MKTGPFLAILIVVCLPSIAQAKLVKCKLPDGVYVVQDVPCAPDPASVIVKRPVVGAKDPAFSQKSQSSANWERTTPLVMDEHAARSGQAAAAEPFSSLPTRFFPSSQQKLALRDSGKSAGPDYLTRKADEERREYDEQAKTRKKQRVCDYARRQAGVAKMQRPIYTVDTKGDRQFIDDQDRSKVIAQADREAALVCQ